MIQALDHPKSGSVAVSSREISSSLAATESRQPGSVSTAPRAGFGLLRKFNTLRYVLLGTGAYAPPIGKFKV